MREIGVEPEVRTVAGDSVAAAAATAIADLKHHHRLTGLVAPEHLHDSIADALAAVNLRSAPHLHGLEPDQIPVFGAEAVKGLEFDAVVVVNPHEIFDGSARGARLLYVAMTRAVQHLTFVTDAPLPTPLDTDR